MTVSLDSRSNTEAMTLVMTSQLAMLFVLRHVQLTLL